MQEKIKEAFLRVKDDIEQLRKSLELINNELVELKHSFFYQQDFQQTDRPADRQTSIPDNPVTEEKIKQLLKENTENLKKEFALMIEFQQTDPHTRQTQTPLQQTDLLAPADKSLFKAVKSQNKQISTRNEGVPADRQTDQQTDRRRDSLSQKFVLTQETPSLASAKDSISKIQEVAEMLDSLDTLKKEIRTQFKRLTQQEMAIFSTIYQLENEGFIVDYPLLASKTKLTESSIRDYIQKIIKKGAPLVKSKENNKRVVLSIAQEFKKVISLPTLLALRNL